MKKIFAIFLSIYYLLTVTSLVLAAPTGGDSAKGLGCGGGFGPIAETLCGLNKGDKEIVGKSLNKVISGVIGFMTIIAALWFIFQFITAGYQWIGAGGDKNNTQAARDKLTNSFIGLMIVVAAWVIIGLVGKMMGIDILNPGKVIQTLGF